MTKEEIIKSLDIVIKESITKQSENGLLTSIFSDALRDRLLRLFNQILKDWENSRNYWVDCWRNANEEKDRAKTKVVVLEERLKHTEAKIKELELQQVSKEVKKSKFELQDTVYVIVAGTIFKGEIAGYNRSTVSEEIYYSVKYLQDGVVIHVSRNEQQIYTKEEIHQQIDKL